MKQLVFAVTLTFAAALVAQQPSRTYPPPGQTQTMPNQQAPGATAQVQQQIEQTWQSQSDLSHDNLKAEVSGNTVTLEGTVNNEAEHQKAVQAATQSAVGMKIVDHIKVQAQ